MCNALGVTGGKKLEPVSFVKIRLKGVFLYLFITVVKVRGNEQIYKLKSIGPRCLYVCIVLLLKAGGVLYI